MRWIPTFRPAKKLRRNTKYHTHTRGIVTHPITQVFSLFPFFLQLFSREKQALRAGVVEVRLGGEGELNTAAIAAKPVRRTIRTLQQKHCASSRFSFAFSYFLLFFTEWQNAKQPLTRIMHPDQSDRPIHLFLQSSAPPRRYASHMRVRRRVVGGARSTFRFFEWK